MQKPNKLFTKQKGAVLILMAFIIGLGVLAYLLHAFNPERLRLEQDKKTYQSLASAKQALISWAVSHPNTPGQLPFPDRGTGGGFDGKSDCYTGVFKYEFLIGELPIYGQTNPCVLPQTGLGGDWQDAQGNRLWYEVSRNLVHHYQAPASDPVINPSIINNPAYPWLTVKDRNGVVISNRVAAVIIAPGEPIGGQDRSGGVANPNQYLDKIVMADNTPYKNYLYPTSDINVQEFIAGEDFRVVAKNDPTYKDQSVEPYSYNDKLVYITIDELIAALEERAVMEAKFLLNSYRAKNGYFPDADLLGTASNISVLGNREGQLPIDITDNCSCSASNLCACSFKPIISVAFKRSSGTWSASNISGACTRTTSTVCTCTGAGFCKNTAGTSNFTCTAAGVCTHNVIGTYTYTPPAYADIYSTSDLAAPGCVKSGGNAACNAIGSFTIGLKEPIWFKTNLWQDYFYYEWSPTANIQAGAKAGISALLIGAGSALPTTEALPAIPQSRPSNNIADYLDSTENADGDFTFDATNKQKTSNYNDQTTIVAP
ncbi:MAG: hypothetical protein WBL28_03540 [Methylotenera sp.]